MVGYKYERVQQMAHNAIEGGVVGEAPVPTAHTIPKQKAQHT